MSELLRKPYTPNDLCVVTGFGRDKVRRGIREGTLPGYVVGRTYTIPAEAFERYVRGEWKPATVKQETEPEE